MKIAVTGANGFIGQYVLKELENRSITASAVVRSAHNLSPCIEGHSIIQMDLHNPPKNVFEELGSPDVLVHLAWSGLDNYMSLQHYEMELPAHYNLLKVLVGTGLKHIVVAGTCLEYGMQSGMLSEDADTNPMNPYGFAKDALRRQLEFLQNERSFSLTWARLFYLYGNGQSDKSIFSQLTNAVKRKENVFNMSGGKQLRDYLPVEIVAKHLVTLAISNHDNGVVNICSGTPVSILDLVEEWVRENDWSIELNPGYYPYANYEPMEFWGNRSKLDRCIN